MVTGASLGPLKGSLSALTSSLGRSGKGRVYSPWIWRPPVDVGPGPVCSLAALAETTESICSGTSLLGIYLLVERFNLFSLGS